VKITQAARLLALGDTAVTVEFGTAVDRAVSTRVLAAQRAVIAANIPGVVETVPTFRALAVHFNPDEIGQEKLVAALGALDMSGDAETAPSRSFTVPVLYDGPDLDAVAQAANVARGEVAKLHADADYHVYMLGFLPGFAYLGDLPQKLRLPRRSEPRTRVPAGSVAIADEMTAIYPAESPGGWHLIGRTPLRLFDPHAHPPSLFSPGDSVTFRAVDEAEFKKLSEAVP
jgi:KipI family sensor histidine kinase inhibitor